MLVIGATACYRSPSPAGPNDPNDPNSTSFAKPPDDPGPTDTQYEEVAPPPPDPTVGAGPPDANRLCATHKATKKPKLPAASRRYAPMGVVGDTAYWDPNRKIATCSIVRERIDTKVQVTRTPTCCPAGMPAGHQCPPSYQTTVPGTRVVVEQVELHADGSVAKSTLTAVETEAEGHREVHHNCGRRPEALQLVGDAPGDDIGGELAAMAELEAASVPAFERLARELAAHGAPVELVERARAAARDEVRHARAMTRLAAARGATPRSLAVGELPIRALEAIAIENAVEGCVRESYGALVATYQAERAAPELRAVFRAIARDEREHAALSEAVAAWLDGAISPAARGAVGLARSAARAELRATLASAPGCEALGVPGGGVAVALFDAYFA